MNINDFRSAMRAFTDDLNDLDLNHGQLVVQIRDEVIEASVTEAGGDIYIQEHGAKKRAFDWLLKRVAKISQLADRITTHVLPEPYFVTPAGRVLDRLDDVASDEESIIQDVPARVIELLSKKPAGTSTVLYVTSDAGEGKTTVIDHMALQQAKKYQKGEADWLLIPMRLGGRSFLTFDDVIVAELVNRFRFQFFYYDAFIELVRLGVLVPAFDGFEEVFVEGSPGEAVSSLASLVRMLNSCGSVVVAVRKAHFEYRDFQDQARFLDATSNVDVTFARVSLERWNRKRFINYAQLRELPNPEPVYDSVSKQLGSDHPLLTRAVLAKRLVDVAEQDEIENLLMCLGTNVADYFFHFVNAIVEREVTEKWIDRSGFPHQPLLTVDEHHVLLAMIAKEMWITSSDAIDGDYLNLITELFAEEHSKASPIARQIANRIGQHSLMATNRAQRPSFSFDHDEFKMFYWGEALARILTSGELAELRRYLGRHSLPDVSVDATMAAMKRIGANLPEALKSLSMLVRQSPSISYIAENAGALAVRILEEAPDAKEPSLLKFYFKANSLRGRRLRNVTFVECDFASSSFEQSEFSDVNFKKCKFHQLELAAGLNVERTRMDECEVSCIVLEHGDSIYNPNQIFQALKQAGFELDQPEDTDIVYEEPDELSIVAKRALRTFLRATAVNQGTLERRLGTKAGVFLKEVLPSMVEHGILERVEYKGQGQSQGRFKLGVSMVRVEKCLAEGAGSSLPNLLKDLAASAK